MTVPKRFGVLRFFGTLLKVIAWIVLVVSVLGAITAVVMGGTNAVTNMLGGLVPAESAALLGAGGGILAGLLFLFMGFVYFLALYVTGETLHLQLAVEENTRLTAALLLRMHQDGQAESATSYSTAGGFVSEPYEN
jgi:hypothetical protein